MGSVELTLDHVVPQLLGGTNQETNLVCCCKACNSAKQDKTLRAFLRYLRSRGVDTGKVAARVRRRTARSLLNFLELARTVRGM